MGCSAVEVVRGGGGGEDPKYMLMVCRSPLTYNGKLTPE